MAVKDNAYWTVVTGIHQAYCGCGDSRCVVATRIAHWLDDTRADQVSMDDLPQLGEDWDEYDYAHPAPAVDTDLDGGLMSKDHPRYQEFVYLQTHIVHHPECPCENCCKII